MWIMGSWSLCLESVSFLGISVNGYKLWHPELRNMVVSKDIVFDELAMINDSPHEDSD